MNILRNSKKYYNNKFVFYLFYLNFYISFFNWKIKNLIEKNKKKISAKTFYYLYL